MGSFRIVPMNDARFLLVSKKLNENFQKMIKDVPYLFKVDVNKEELWNLFLDSHPADISEIYIKRRKTECVSCRQFVNDVGNVVVIKNQEIITIWGFECGDQYYQKVFDTLDKYIKSHAIANLFVPQSKKIGVEKNFSKLADGTRQEWRHFYVMIPKKFKCKRNETVESEQEHYLEWKNVLKYCLEEISEESILTVLNLNVYQINQWKYDLNWFLEYKREYDKLSNEKKELYLWEKTSTAGSIAARINNLRIGSLLVDITRGVALDVAVEQYERIPNRRFRRENEKKL